MLYPVSIFDGEDQHRDSTTMPLIGGRDLHSPAAELRVATRDLEAERAKGVEKSGRIARLEAELAEANSQAVQLAADRDGAGRAFAAEREAWLQQKVALQAGKTALEGELAETRVRLSAATNLRAQRDSQIAQLRAEIEDGRQQFDVQQKAIAALEGANLDLSGQLEEAARENQRLRGHATLLESEAGAAQEHAIEITHTIAPLVEELNQMRRDHRSLAVEREAAARDKAILETEIGELTTRITEANRRAAALEARIAASPGARLTALWRRFATRCAVLFRSERVPNYPEGTPHEGLRDSKIRASRGPGSASP
jgi:chromosome segregation ATPase